MNIIFFATTQDQVDLKTGATMGIPFFDLEQYDSKVEFLDDLAEKFEKLGLNPTEFVLLRPYFESREGKYIDIPEVTGIVTERDVSDSYWDFWRDLDAHEGEKLIAYIESLGTSCSGQDIEDIYKELDDYHFGVFNLTSDFAEQYLETYHSEELKKMSSFLKDSIDLDLVALNAIKKEGYSCVDNGTNLHYFRP